MAPAKECEMERINPILPGEILLTEFMAPNGISQTKLAEDLDISQKEIEDIVNGKRGITVDTAKRLSVYFSTSINFWVTLQNNYDLEKTARPT